KGTKEHEGFSFKVLFPLCSFVSFVVNVSCLFSQFSKIDPELLALLIQMTAFQAQGFCGIGDVVIIAVDRVEVPLTRDLFHSFRQCTCCSRKGGKGARWR